MTQPNTKPVSSQTCSIHADHDHKHGKECGHVAVQHGDHVDYQHDGHLHRVHGKHVDECAGAAPVAV